MSTRSLVTLLAWTWVLPGGAPPFRRAPGSQLVELGLCGRLGRIFLQDALQLGFGFLDAPVSGGTPAAKASATASPKPS